MPHAPPFIRDIKRRGARRQGIKYEEKVHENFSCVYREQYLAGQWFQFLARGDRAPRWCQADALLIDIERGIITLVEVKYNHTALAWWQLKKLYLPVVQAIFGGGWAYATCEVVKWFDPHVPLPEPVAMRRHLHDARPGEMALHIFNP